MEIFTHVILPFDASRSWIGVYYRTVNQPINLAQTRKTS
ncbi:hypothetical protein Z948_1636 [Sulfitobacter donghicola DSW-25 = KCTC 12864 = JCM 14565]|nr:hypothetical protein Z948_1636 [Sulfitobacter donghicola DSW-25 = KCTC 12864 = JCM 14565]